MSEENYMQKFVQGMTIAMAIHGMTKVDVTKAAGINASFMARLCDAKKSSNPRLSTLMKIASALGMTIEDIIDLPDRAKELIDAKN